MLFADALQPPSPPAPTGWKTELAHAGDYWWLLFPILALWGKDPSGVWTWILRSAAIAVIVGGVVHWWRGRRTFTHADELERARLDRLGCGVLASESGVSYVLTTALLALHDAGTATLVLQDDMLWLQPGSDDVEWPTESPEGRLRRNRTLCVRDVIADWMADKSNYPFRRAARLLAHGAIARGIAVSQDSLDDVPLTATGRALRTTESVDVVGQLFAAVREREHGLPDLVSSMVVATLRELTVPPERQMTQQGVVLKYNYQELSIQDIEADASEVGYAKRSEEYTMADEAKSLRVFAVVGVVLLAIAAGILRSRINESGSGNRIAFTIVAALVTAVIALGARLWHVHYRTPPGVKRLYAGQFGCAGLVAGVAAVAGALVDMGWVVLVVAVLLGVVIYSVEGESYFAGDAARKAVADRLDHLARQAAEGNAPDMSGVWKHYSEATVRRDIPLRITRATEMAADSEEFTRRRDWRPALPQPHEVPWWLWLPLPVGFLVIAWNWHDVFTQVIGGDNLMKAIAFVAVVVVWAMLHRYVISWWVHRPVPPVTVSPDEPLPLRLLVLRVFNSPAFDDLVTLVADWELVGPLEHLDGGDTVGQRPEVLTALREGRLDDIIIDTPEEVQTQLNAVFARNEEGRYARRTFQCGYTVWRDVIKAMMDRTDAVVMDLSNYSAENEGSSYELTELLHRVPLSRVTLLVSDTTDLDVLRRALADAASRIPQDSPNATGEIEWRLVELGGRSERRADETHHEYMRRADTRLGGRELLVHLLQSAWPPRTGDGARKSIAPPMPPEPDIGWAPWVVAVVFAFVAAVTMASGSE